MYLLNKVSWKQIIQGSNIFFTEKYCLVTRNLSFLAVEDYIEMFGLQSHNQVGTK